MDIAFPDISAIAKELNSRAISHPIGHLQTIRAKLQKLSHRSGSVIFSLQTIHPKWAFHHGGRKELQFNIGVEEISGGIELRHGVAFSFQPSRSLPSIDVLIPKVRLYNDYLQLYPELYADMRMWHFRQGERSTDYPPSSITSDLVTSGTFVFLGKRQASDNLNYDTILHDFDRLLTLYEYVESSGTEESGKSSVKKGFHFRPGFTTKSLTASATLAERELNINLKHNILQAALCRKLISKYGSDNVRDEQPSGLGTKIDVVLRRGKDKYWYFEIKTASSPQACIREAFGQILEYAYWPGAHEAERLIICGENPIDEDGKKYLRQLKRRFQLPIEYQQIVP